MVEIAAVGKVLLVGFLSPFHCITDCFTLSDEVIYRCAFCDGFVLFLVCLKVWKNQQFCNTFSQFSCTVLSAFNP